ncbi:30S ribosomal protein S17 [Candidatus Dojkabacteria bacterium]|uniref:30S ribosomal protein S17 n=2 Tax=Candidatus Dojkabacteria TaxID=74243 RepID=A0A136KKW2_9BACT|nr:MAG: 30S ribosomal protein S17 [candidate division WS6 bacterium OLB21]MBW7953592.1 30S ribosomal protein S17 [Candidatus Dojkabacteria bacterium]
MKADKTKTTTENRKPKWFVGEVIKNSAENTIVVKVESKYAHPKYGKIIKVHKTYQAHCEDKTVTVGDIVMIEEGRPVSRHKSFYFRNKVEKKS